MHIKMDNLLKLLKLLRHFLYSMQGFFLRIKFRFAREGITREFKTCMRFFPENAELAIEDENSYIHDAEMICDHRFNVFGSEKSFGEEIQWNKDYRSGYVWSNKYFKCIKKSNAYNNADIKQPWELSRFNHFIILGKAYQITGDERYSAEFQKQISNWIKENPFEFSLNWTCSMELAIRSINWIAGYFYFRDSCCIDVKFWSSFYNSLFLHGCFISRHLENKAEFTNNHYIADLIGLVWLGLFFKNVSFKVPRVACRAKRWLKTGINSLISEISVQVNRDGTHYESSTYYHKFVTEMLLITEIICQRNNVEISEEYSSILEIMIKFLCDLLKPDGSAPLIGDADDGRILIFSDYFTREAQDFRHLLAMAGDYFKREDFKRISSRFIAEANWANGNSSVIPFQNNRPNECNNSSAYIEGGYYFLKNKRVYCLIKCGPLGCKGTGGHSHNDQLSFVLTVDGDDYFVDPGTYVYTGDYSMRNLFRSTGMHNTLILEGLEQNDIEWNNPFKIKEQTNSVCTEFSSANFRGKHFGYREKAGITHHRKLFLIENGIIVEDLLEGNLNSVFNAYLNYTLHPNVEIVVIDKMIELRNRSSSIRLIVNKESQVQIEDSYVSTAYGLLTKTSKIKIGIGRINTSHQMVIYA